jgi:hypothetical protein
VEESVRALRHCTNVCCSTLQRRLRRPILRQNFSPDGATLRWVLCMHTLSIRYRCYLLLHFLGVAPCVQCSSSSSSAKVRHRRLFVSYGKFLHLIKKSNVIHFQMCFETFQFIPNFFEDQVRQRPTFTAVPFVTSRTITFMTFKTVSIICAYYQPVHERQLPPS